MKYEETIHFYNCTDRGADYNMKVQEIIEILLTIQTFVFFTKYQQFH